MNFRKPVVWIGVAAVLILIVAGVICLTDTRENSSESGNSTGEERNHSETESSTGAGIEEKYVLEPYEKMLASTRIHGYEVQFVYTPLDKKQTVIDDLEQMYKGGEGEFELRTCKDNILSARLPFRSDDTFAYFPVEGFDLVVKDYDGDAAYDDFFIGQGQIPDSAMGNYMKYWLYTVEEDGSIKEYDLSDQLLTRQNSVYSGEFEYKDGKIQYWGLGSNGYDEEQTEKEIKGIVRDSSNPKLDSGEEVSAATDQDEQTAEKEYEVVLAKAQIHGYDVRFVYSPQDKKIKKKSGMYEGEFELRTYNLNSHSNYNEEGTGTFILNALKIAL